MGLKQEKQPEIRFDKVGPNSLAGISYVPKVIAFKKESISGTSNDDFWAAPAGTFITCALVRIDALLDGSGVITLGTDGDADALIDATDLDTSTVGNSASNIGSTTAAGAVGLYLKDGDNIRLAVTGSPTVGAVSGVIIYYEMEAIEDRGFHFDLT